jgi:hypothetical protein
MVVENWCNWRVDRTGRVFGLGKTEIFAWKLTEISGKLESESGCKALLLEIEKPEQKEQEEEPGAAAGNQMHSVPDCLKSECKT